MKIVEIITEAPMPRAPGVQVAPAKGAIPRVTTSAPPKPAPAGVSQEELDNRIAGRGNDLDATGRMGNSFTDQMKGRDAEKIAFDSPASREIRDKIKNADLTGLSPEQVQQMQQAEKEFTAPREPIDPAVTADLEKYAT